MHCILINDGLFWLLLFEVCKELALTNSKIVFKLVKTYLLLCFRVLVKPTQALFWQNEPFFDCYVQFHLRRKRFPEILNRKHKLVFSNLFVTCFTY